MLRVPPRAAPSAVPLRDASSLPAAPAPPVAPPFVSAGPQAASTTAVTAASAVSDVLVLLIDSSSSAPSKSDGHPGRRRAGPVDDRRVGLANGRNPRCHPLGRAPDRDQRVMVVQCAAWRHRGAAASGPPRSEPGPIDVASSASAVLTTRLT